jgi:hypothetical protein
MVQLDKIHNAVKNAIIKDGWTITVEPLRLGFEKVNLLIDVAAEKTFAAEKDGRKLPLKAKVFLIRHCLII